MPKYMPAFLAAILACGMCVRADSGPQPPCAGPPFPPVPDVDAAPVVKVWERADWTPAACTGWTASAGATVVATAARFRYNGEAPGLRRRIGAISALAGMLYWSTTNQRWQPLIVDAYALSGPSDDQRRQDFSPDEIVEGRILYVHQEDNLVGKAIYRIRIVTATAARLVFATENSSTIRYMSIPVFPPGEIQSIVFLERESGGVWRYYSIVRTGKQASLLTAGHEASLVNRAVASYRHLAGIPTDTEPPASR